MSLAVLNKVKKYYGDSLILDIDKFEILQGDRIGVVGKNGVGKTTLLKILLGEVEVNDGQCFLTDSYSYISQREDFIGQCKKSRIKKIFHGPDEYKDYLSGGEKIKLRIVNALSENKNLIIADEPTSNLDKSSIKTLEEILKGYKGALLIVSHDRKFLNELCNTIVEIEDGKLSLYKGNYNKYVELKKEKRKNEETEYNKYIREKNRLEKAIVQKSSLRDRIKQAPKGMGPSEAKTLKMGDQRGKKNIDDNIKAIKSRINHLEVKKKPKTEGKMTINIQKGMDISSKNPIEVKELKLSIGDKILITKGSFKIKKGKKIAIIGENGCGKSTLIKEILRGDNESLKISSKVLFGYFDQEQNDLKEEQSILENIKYDCSYDESFIRIILSNFGFKENHVYKEVRTLSGGERVKVALCKVMLSDNNILILDEPTNYLDIKAMEALELALINTDKTVIIVSHDREFITNLCNYIIHIENKEVKEFDCSYKEYLEKINKPKINKEEKKHNDELFILENKLTEVLSRLSVESDIEKKEQLDREYNKLLKNIKALKLLEK